MQRTLVQLLRSFSDFLFASRTQKAYVSATESRRMQRAERQSRQILVD